MDALADALVRGADCGEGKAVGGRRGIHRPPILADRGPRNRPAPSVNP